MTNLRTGILAGLVVTQMAWAGIGQESSTIANDCEQLNGLLKTVSTTQQECISKGYKVDFYLNSGGQISRISWIGHKTPPFAVLLASFSDEYSKAYRADPQAVPGNRSVRHETEHLRVTRRGTARVHSGEIVFKSQTH